MSNCIQNKQIYLKYLDLKKTKFNFMIKYVKTKIQSIFLFIRIKETYKYKNRIEELLFKFYIKFVKIKKNQGKHLKCLAFY